MPITSTCPTRSAAIVAPDKAAGRGAKCPRCGQRILIPAADAIQASVTSPPTPPPAPTVLASAVTRRGRWSDRRRRVVLASTGALVVTVAVVAVLSMTGWSPRPTGPAKAPPLSNEIDQLRQQLAAERRERQRLEKLVAARKTPAPAKREAHNSTPKPPTPAKTVADIEAELIEKARRVQATLDRAKLKRDWDLMPHDDAYAVGFFRRQIGSRLLSRQESAFEESQLVSRYIDHFDDRALAVRRLLQYADSERWTFWLGKLRIVDPYVIVESKLQYCSLGTLEQEEAKGVVERILTLGMAQLGDEDKQFIRYHPCLLPLP